jgi:1-phosphofructokinase family hexose kinase
MILCVTLNPCLDKTLVVPDWHPGQSVRGSSLREVVGGKGNNVARALKRLGRDVRPVTFLGGMVGEHCERLLRKGDGLDPIVVRSAAPTRVILTVRNVSSDDQTAFFDPDPAISVQEATELATRVEELLRSGQIEALTLSGSSPAPATHELYSELIALAKARKVPVFLDTYGPALDAIWGFWPTAIQINRREAAMLLHQRDVTDHDVDGLLERWKKRGVLMGCVTDGREPVFILHGGKRYIAAPPEIRPINPIGSGDSVLAGFVDGWLRGLEPEALISHALGCGVANALVWDAAAIDPIEVSRWSSQIKVRAV